MTTEPDPVHALDELGELRQWVGWRLDPPREGSTKPVKFPVDAASGFGASSTDPTTWCDAQTAIDALDAHPDWAGVGFVFTQADPYVGVDLDGCRAADTGVLAEWAAEIVRGLDSYTEISPSGTGVHVIVRAKLPPAGRRKGRVEMYETGRYFTMTGTHLDGTPVSIMRRQAAIEAMHRDLFGALEDVAPRVARSGVAPAGDDRTLLDRMFRSAKGDRIQRLWNGDTSMHDGDDSGADLALCDYLAFWTGGDFSRVDRLFRDSGLYREKWDEKRGALTYGQRTVAFAISGKTFAAPAEQVRGGVAA